MDYHDLARAVAWFMGFVGTASLGASFGSGIMALPVRRNLNCQGYVDSEKCLAIFGQIEMVVLVTFLGGLVALACGLGALWMLQRQEREHSDAD